MMQNIIDLCHIHFFVEGFLGGMLSTSRVEGNPEKTKLFFETLDDGKKLLAEILKKARKISKELNVEINEEAVPYGASTSSYSPILMELHVGISANNFLNSYVVRFISDIFRKKLGFNVRDMNLFIYYLPPLPAIVTNEGVKDAGSGGFYSPSKKRVEINFFQFDSLNKIYNHFVHEMIHHVIFIDPTIEHSELITEQFCEQYSNISKKDFSLNKKGIFESLNEIGRSIFAHLEEFNSKLSFLEKHRGYIKKCNELQKIIANGEVEFHRLDGKNLDDFYIHDKEDNLT